MMKATGLKRGSRKKQPQQQQSQPSNQLPQVIDNDDGYGSQRSSQQQSVPLQPHPAETPQQQQQQPAPSQRRKQNEEVAALTTKNYRLAKELADLRVRYRDESKNVTRLTMENMNLASRCREAISHVAMLKKELANQQKRTASAIAAQREQTQRMADSLSNSMEISRVSRSPSAEEISGSSDNDNSGKEQQQMSHLVTDTPSPLRSSVRGGSTSTPTSPTASSPESNASSNTSGSSRALSPEEARDSPPVEKDTIVQAPSSSAAVVVSDTESGEDLSPEKKGGKPPMVYSTPKRGDRWTPSFDAPGGGDDDENEGRLFPHSASPQVFSSRKKSYNEEFPSDIQANRRRNGSDDDSDEEEEKGAFDTITSQQRKINLLNSIDAFEQSFSVDFPDSFTPKDGNSGSGGKKGKTDIYNPFFNTPERSIGRPKKTNLFSRNDEEEKKTGEPSSPSSFETPPRLSRKQLGDDAAGEPARPEKTASLSARERYEKALQPKSNKTGDEKPARSNSPAALLRRIQKKRSNDEADQRNGGDAGTRNSDSDIVDIVDSFEGNSGPSGRQSLGSRFGLRRNVKKPISYAEPALNTKLRQGDTYFPKTEDQQAVSVVSP